jgi:hypothetical protein
LFAKQFSPDDTDRAKRAIAFLAVSLIGISQIGAIVCSLSSLSSGVLRVENMDNDRLNGTAASDVLASTPEDAIDDTTSEQAGLLNSKISLDTSTLSNFKGSVAGVYSFYGGAAILLLTKLGGYLFDRVSTGAPFYIMASFNGVLLLACISSYLKRLVISN